MRCAARYRNNADRYRLGIEPRKRNLRSIRRQRAHASSSETSNVVGVPFLPSEGPNRLIVARNTSTRSRRSAPETGNCLTALRHENIRGLDVPVHDAPTVRGLQSLGDLYRHVRQHRRP